MIMNYTFEVNDIEHTKQKLAIDNVRYFSHIFKMEVASQVGWFWSRDKRQNRQGRATKWKVTGRQQKERFIYRG